MRKSFYAKIVLLLPLILAVMLCCACDDGGGTSDGGLVGGGGGAGNGGGSNSPDGGSNGPNGGGSSGSGSSSPTGGGGDSGTTGGGGDSGTSGGEDDGGGSEENPGTLLGTYKWTHYWLEYEAEYTDDGCVKDTNIYNMAGAVIATVCSEYATELKDETVGYLEDGRFLDGQGPCSKDDFCFDVWPDSEVLKYPYWVGSDDNPLHPWRSVASDPAVIPFGAKLYIKELDGVALPDPSPVAFDPATEGFVWDDTCNCFRHDGCVVVEDTGTGVIGNHLDFFALSNDIHHYLQTEMNLPVDANFEDQITVYKDSPRCQ